MTPAPQPPGMGQPPGPGAGRPAQRAPEAQPPAETGRRNVRLLVLLLGVVGGLLVASILFVAFRR